MSSLTWGVSEQAQIPGLGGAVALSYSAEYTYGVTSSSSFSLDLVFLTSSETHYFNVACVGGTGSGSGTVLDVWLATAP